VGVAFWMSLHENDFSEMRAEIDIAAEVLGYGWECKTLDQHDCLLQGDDLSWLDLEPCGQQQPRRNPPKSAWQALEGLWTRRKDARRC
jgi:hypothetical protein